ncbi:MAG: inositol monophosphatase family protein [Patescibacteria group bacterium]
MKTLNFSREVLATLSAAESAGKNLQNCESNASNGIQADEKRDALGHHAVVTCLDYTAQSAIIGELAKQFPEALFLAEEQEKEHHKLVIPKRNLPDIKKGLRFGVDSIDGTSAFAHGLPEWSVSVGVMKNGVHIGGCITSPPVFGGFTVTGEIGKGVLVREGARVHDGTVRGSQLPKKCVIKLGPDLFFSDQYRSFIFFVSQLVQTAGSCGSGALALALVAAGKLDAVVQPVQCPWDWFAGYPLITAAGGSFLFYHYRKGIPERMKTPDLESYNTTTRKTAYIAGNPVLVETLWQQLISTWQYAQ